ncbi:Segregation and condensation protein B [Olavius algarvensis associated proteobacterium Delta 3]|nr:Segregation and condensation protein B [Olavius algarvensis associated proteobacterium Delta 3]CAB5131052.1 Segregation and condensation protein B [Olavius algarvensis associated proteobacterium Delta 3]
MDDDIKYIIESLLFVADEPLTIDRMRAVLNVTERAPIREALQALEDEYQARGGGFHLKAVAGGYQLRTRSEYKDWIKTLIQPKPPRLSKAALETLATIAYKQPVIRSDIEHIRGVDCGGVLRMLLKRKMIRVLGRKEIPGRPLIYGTTRQFLEVFDLQDLKDLPTPKEIEELSDMAEEVLETGLADDDPTLPFGEPEGDHSGPPPSPQGKSEFGPPPSEVIDNPSDE